MSIAVRSALVTLLATVNLACSGGNGFSNVDSVEGSNGAACSSSSECQVIVDCCNRQNVCLHQSGALATCKVDCAEAKAPPAVICQASRCHCQ